MSKNHAAGGKATGSHTTYIDAAEEAVKFLEKSPLVRKYSLGIIKAARSRQRKMKLTEDRAGVKMSVYGNVYLQEIFVYVDSAAAFRKKISEELADRYLIR